MVLRFNIENEPNLPDGGPVSFTVTGRRSVDIGRDRHLDWTLPDPARMISGKHCEIHYRDGGYWLHDVSTNGTFLNGADQRIRGAHRLRNGDRLVIGHYVIGVSLDLDEPAEGTPSHGAQQPAPLAQQHADYQELWAPGRDVPPPIDPQQLRKPREAARPVNPEFLDWAASVPPAGVDPVRHSPQMPHREPPLHDDMSWAAGPVATPKPPVDVLHAMPTPRRPSVWADDEAAVLPPPAPSPAGHVGAPRPQLAEPAPAMAASIGNPEFARLVARAAGLPDGFFADKTEAELAEQLGVILRMTVENLMALLQARTQAKQLTRSTSQTTIQAIENNPLKFSPTAEDAMRILFGPPTRSYLDAPHAFAQGFKDLKSHQLKTYAAMQHAVRGLIASIDPTLMARELELQRGARSLFGSNKSKLWDEFLTRWNAHLGRDESAPIDTFMLHFSEYYDRADKPGSK
ncbi:MULTISPECIES: type VI secretion system-associated FHA domain protein TagH [Bradyrhizobium]|jgi:type VI secretion system protein ImpI|uniref:type VI secretion system-associated FHA domain protein TagH n=1 Tax=Bradyrhizobium TaxID=374 RepID=UPI000484A9A5|nr:MULTISPECIES: type VI secretion system-associated FHA domain protein TagH [Bradyrhizobium]MCS3450446.1 type VI secretion system protein ImpI [Bradyrhizobium elkanii]MCS3558409.1 type VI secretion system protein ImpI [Bradyrhizobium elkanii]MCW2151744.1 type VI secretion system protein ImpI [Bradyrhizobium elkanii]MCW2358383.1 type VI secretion system protein ImpI [Bradyrhizobium elkanii]MCW2375475.1 type VI secretion system protein ImpI [Bradyrhizobium elkanii]